MGSAKFSERNYGARVDFRKAEGFFRKMTVARPIRTVRAADRTATKSRRRGHAGWPASLYAIISLDSTFLMHVQHEQIQNIVIVMRGDRDRPLIMYEVQCIVCLLRSSNKKIQKKNLGSRYSVSM